MAPEVLFQNRYSYASDIFAFGIMYYELLHLVTPWESSSEDELKARLTYSQQIRFKDGISAGVRQVLAACLQMDPNRRPTI